MKIISSIAELQTIRREIKVSNPQATIGFVPTMGALHAGHASLLEKARSENDIVILSIFVNPTQFNDPKDFEKYPINLENDLDVAKTKLVDYVFLPNSKEIYHDNYRFKLTENELSKKLEGEFRPGHFDGVLTVVLKLFNLVQAHRAYFGEKDFQQLQLITDMAKSLFLDVQVIACPTLRENDGLAMSSRNIRLNAEARKKSVLISKLLNSEKSCDEITQELKLNGFEVEYVKEDMGRRFCAAHIGGVRLIDNVSI